MSVDGTPDIESLTPRGWQRAGAIVGLFVARPAAEGTGTPLPTPSHLFASEIGPHSQSRRPIETLQPLAERLGLTITETFLQDELDGLVSAIRACDGDVLVAWEHKRIPLIAQRLVSDPAEVPQVWPDDRYDVVWVLEPAEDPVRRGFASDRSLSSFLPETDPTRSEHLRIPTPTLQACE